MAFEVLEKTIEAYGTRRVRKLGGIAYKFTSPGRRSVPDRLVVLPMNYLIFIEYKRPKMKLTKKQAAEANRLRSMGAVVYCADTKMAVDLILWIYEIHKKRVSHYCD